MLAHNLDIYKSHRMLISTLLGYTRNVSRDVKYAEWAAIRTLLFDAMDLIYLVNSEQDASLAAHHLDTYLFKMFGATNRIRLLAEAGYLKVGFKTRVIEQIEECSKQAVAWRKYLRRKDQNCGVNK